MMIAAFMFIRMNENTFEWKQKWLVFLSTTVKDQANRRIKKRTCIAKWWRCMVMVEIIAWKKKTKQKTFDWIPFSFYLNYVLNFPIPIEIKQWLR